MEFKLIELNLFMSEKEYDMYQDIPAKESGSVNLCKGLSYNVFQEYLESQKARKFNNISHYDTPTLLYIMYKDEYPIGYVGLRLKIDEDWEKWSGNIFYTIRKSERGKGYGNKILELGLKKLKEKGLSSALVNCSNEISQKVIEHNNGQLIKEENRIKYYRIIL